jgi:rsbT antagonist protein RsbS
VLPDGRQEPEVGAGRQLTLEQIPILKLGNCLLVTIQVELHDQLAMTLQDDLTQKLSRTQAKGVLIDISALEIVDSFIGRSLAQIAGIARVMDATTVLVGMRPAVAITLVELGMSLKGIKTALNVDKGMQLLRNAQQEAGFDEPAAEGDPPLAP